MIQMLLAPVCQRTPRDVTTSSSHCKAPHHTGYMAPHQHLSFNLGEVTPEVSSVHALTAHISEADRGYPYSSHALNDEVQLITVPVLNN